LTSGHLVTSPQEPPSLPPKTPKKTIKTLKKTHQTLPRAQNLTKTQKIQQKPTFPLYPKFCFNAHFAKKQRKII